MLFKRRSLVFPDDNIIITTVIKFLSCEKQCRSLTMETYNPMRCAGCPAGRACLRTNEVKKNTCHLSLSRKNSKEKYNLSLKNDCSYGDFNLDVYNIVILYKINSFTLSLLTPRSILK